MQGFRLLSANSYPGARLMSRPSCIVYGGLMRLSIIIPAYNAEPYLDSLLERLLPQLNKDCEVIIVDDGSKTPYSPKGSSQFLRVIHKENGGASSARNAGLDLAKGQYIAFIDADDLVTEDYIAQVFAKLDEKPDYVYLSWETIGNGWQARVLLRTIEDEFPPDNLCVWNRVYKRTLIGKTRFNTAKKVAEDAEFIRLVELAGKKKAFISKPIYLYRSDTPNSLSKRFASGGLDTQRVVYYIPHVTADMDLLEEFREADKTAEVILMTDKNEQPELKRYAMVIPPRPITATEARGDYTPLIKLLPKPIKTQIVLWTSFAQEIGGIETFTYAFCKQLSKYYDIICLYDIMAPAQIERVSRFCECRKNDPKRTVECEFLVVNRIIDKIPENINAKMTVQMVHGARVGYADVPGDRDIIVTVSDYVKKTWTDRTKDAKVIHNVLPEDKTKDKPLLLVTASRLDAKDKGVQRMCQLGNLMDAHGMDYVWLCFSNVDLPRNASKGMIRMRPTLDIMSWIMKADYLVQLSDEEAFCYSLAEALSVGTPVIVTPLGINEELGIEDGINAHVVPFDLKDFDPTPLRKIPKFKWPYDNDEVIGKWRELFGPMKPTHSYKPSDLVTVEATTEYHDTLLGRLVHRGEKIRVTNDRASQIVGAGYGKRIY